MKLTTNNFGFQGNLPGNRMGARIKTSAKLFDVLSSGIYTDPILAPIRELSCNAWDAHVAAGCTDRKFTVFVPSWLEPTFSVEDYGTGIHPDKFQDIFYTYGASTKSDSDDFIGALGLGSKSPFAYTKSSYTVRNRFDGKEYLYFCFINEDGQPDGSLISTEDTDQPNGVKVEFAVKPEDCNAFIERISRFYRLWQGTMPEFTNVEIDDLKLDTSVKVLQGSGWYLEGTAVDRTTTAIAMMGNVPYKIDVSSIPNLPPELKVLCSNSFVVTFPMGSLNFAASREGLKYDENTSKKIISRFEEVRRELSESFLDQATNAATQLEFVNNFSKVFNQFRSIVTSSRSISSDDYETHTKMLLGKKPSEKIKFKGVDYVIGQLIKAEITTVVPMHQSFGLISAGTRGRNSKIWMNPCSNLVYKAIDEIKADFFDPIYKDAKTAQMRQSSWDAGRDYSMNWRDATFRKTKKQVVDLLIEHSSLFEVTTTHVVKLKVDHKLQFIINDVGGSAHARFKLLAQRAGREVMVLVDFDQKVSTVAEITGELDALIANGYEGAEIVLISSLPDHRTQIEKVKPETGTLKLKSYYIEQDTGFLETNVEINGVAASVKSKSFVNLRAAAAEKLHKVAELKTRSVLYYIIKRRSPTNYYDSFTSDSPTIARTERVMNLSLHFGFFELDSKNRVEIFTLNEGQINWLRKQGVKTVSVLDTIRTKIQALHAVEKFSDNLAQALGIEQVAKLPELYNFVLQRNKANLAGVSGSFYHDLVKQYVDAVSGKAALSEKLAKVYLLRHVAGILNQIDTGAKFKQETEKALFKIYPLLRYIPIDSNSAAELKKYLDEVDQKVVAATEFD